MSNKPNDDDKFDIRYLRMSEKCYKFKYLEIPGKKLQD